MSIFNKKSSKYKTSWYDGWLFSKFIDRFSGKRFIHVVKNLIEDNVSVLDIGCGTGAFCLGLADSCSQLIGVDISPKMIRFAESAKLAGDYPNVEFILKEKKERLSTCVKKDIDYVNFMLVIHEMDEASRHRLIEEAKEISGNFIITEWISPQPRSIYGLIANIIEFVAGREHHRNFKDWCERGGIDGFLERHKFELIEDKLTKRGTVKVVKARLK